MSEKPQLREDRFNLSALADTPSPEVAAELVRELERLSEILLSNNPIPEVSEDMFHLTAATSGIRKSPLEWRGN